MSSRRFLSRFVLGSCLLGCCANEGTSRAADPRAEAAAPGGLTKAAVDPRAKREATEASQHAAETEAAPYERIWVGVAGALDLVVLPSGTDLCKLTPQAIPANSLNAYCTAPDGGDFPARTSSAQNDALIEGHSGAVNGGVQIGDVRALVAVDYALSPALLVGARVGYVANAYQGAAAVQDGRASSRDLHVEIRATYLFGPQPLAHVGFAPMAFVAGGASEFDGHLASEVRLTGIAGGQPVNIWVTGGPWFATVGGGVRYGFSLRSAFTAALRLNAAFAGTGVLPTAGPEVGFQYGF